MPLKLQLNARFEYDTSHEYLVSVPFKKILLGNS